MAAPQEVVNPSITDRKLNHIDQLRGLAILLVLMVHVFQSQSSMNPRLYCVSDFGKIGVQLFFFLSAYTLCLSCDNKKQLFIKDFYIRRFFRIAPLYYSGILIYAVLSHLPQLNLNGQLSHLEGYTFANVLANLLFIHGLIPSANNTIVPGGWSIGTEVLFYFFFPAIYAYYCRVVTPLKLVFLPFLAFFVASAFALSVQYFTGGAYSNSFYYYFILNQLPVFALGMSYYFLEKADRIKLSIIQAGVISLVLISISFELMYKLGNNISLPIFIAGLSFCGLIRFFKLARLPLPFLSRIGQLSFSIYIFHFLFAWPFTSWLVSLLTGRIHLYLVYVTSYVLALILSFILAYVSERLIEKPGIELGKAMIRRMRAQAVLIRSK